MRFHGHLMRFRRTAARSVQSTAERRYGPLIYLCSTPSTSFVSQNGLGLSRDDAVTTKIFYKQSSLHVYTWIF